MSDQPTQSAPAIRQEPKTVKDFLALPAYKSRFDEVMGKRAPQFLASITNYVTQSKQVAECEPRSIIAAAFVAATLDLPIDKNLGMAWIVPYKGKAQFQLGARGVTQLALRSSQYERLNAKAINADAFGGYDKAVGEPIILWDKVDDDKPVFGYAVAWRLVNGFTKTAFWSKQKVENHAARYSQSYRSRKPGQPWNDHFDAMALKTVCSNELRKWGVLSIELQRAFAHDQGSQTDIDAEVVHDDGTSLFETGESLSDVLGDKKAPVSPDIPSTPPAASKAQESSQKAESGVAYTEADFAKTVAECENVALNLQLAESKLIAHCVAQNWPLGEASQKRKVNSLPYATLLKLRAYLDDEAKKAMGR